MDKVRILLGRLPRLSRRARMARNFAIAIVLGGMIWLAYGMPMLKGDLIPSAAERRELLEHGTEWGASGYYRYFGIRQAKHYYNVYSVIDGDFPGDSSQWVEFWTVPRTGEPVLITLEQSGGCVAAMDTPEEAVIGQLTLRLWGTGFDEICQYESTKDTWGRFYFFPQRPSGKGDLAWDVWRWFFGHPRPERTDVFYEMTARFYDKDGNLVTEIHDKSGGDAPA